MNSPTSLYSIHLTPDGEVSTKAAPVSAGFSTGSPYLDTYNKTRAPSPYDLIRECLSTAYACATLNADLVASTPLRLYVKTSRRRSKSRLMERGDTKALSSSAIRRMRALPGTGKMLSDAVTVEEVTNHPLLNLLARPTSSTDNDAAGMSEYTLFEITQRYQEVRGIAYWYIQRDGVGRTPTAIWSLPAHLVQEIPDLSGERVISYYWYTGATAAGGQRYEVDEIVAFRFPDLNTGGYSGGFSPLRACFEEVSLFRQHKAIVNAQLRNGGKPSAIWSPAGDGMIGDAEAKRMRNAFTQAFGMSKAGGVMTMEQAGKLDILSWPTTQIITAEEFQMAKVSIANCFGVPTSKLDRNDANLASAKTGDYAHAKDAGLPRLRRNEAAINCFLIPMFDPDGQLFVAYDDPTGMHDEAMEFEKSKAAVSVGAVLRNEIRVDLGYDAVPWGDQPLANKDMVGVDLKTGLPLPQLAPVGPNGQAIGAKPPTPADGTGEMPATPEPITDTQAPAVATNDLRATVGGSTAILAIQAAYYAGTLPRDAAIANATLVFGFTAEEAGHLFPAKVPEHKPEPVEPAPVVVAKPKSSGNNTACTFEYKVTNEPATSKTVRVSDLLQGEANDDRHSANPLTGSKGGDRTADEIDACIQAPELSGSDHCTEISLSGESVAAKATTAHPSRIGNRDVMTGLAGPLPQGEALAHVLKSFFHRQCTAALDALDSHGKAADDHHDRFQWEDFAAGIPSRFTPLEPWTEELAKEAQPIIEMMMQHGAEALNARIGADPEVLRVVNANIPEAARNLTLKFSEATNATTTQQLETALQKLRGELAEGLEAGDTRIQLRKRVQEVFDEADNSRAETIARTEASRATHRGEKIAAEKSGVVKAKHWIASADACDICLSHAALGDVPLDYVYDDNADWPCTECPCHPRDQCAMGYTLKNKEEIEAFATGDESPDVAAAIPEK